MKQILAHRADNRDVAMTTNLADGSQRLFTYENLAAAGDARQAVEQALRRDRSALVEINGERLFVHVFSGELRLIIVGAVHIAMPLIELGRLCGYAVKLIDPRLAFATEERFPDVDRVLKWPDVALADMSLDRKTAIVTLTHDPKLDEPALIAAVKSEAFYVGALGSRKTHGERCARLKEAGISDGQLERIHAPVGLNIGAQSPSEIALSIMAQITQALRVVEES